ncbi:hypothetical protein [Candidatus Bodocaedibacter vickermanii]|uniref:Uncharacterized protein n=1 Tax=Candidatus Bodocaedibacter vickermanii TaxID=2741701 RepID=A0A7L9RT61_9PROT|nr:hypothetical protein CPBP_00514 [Candidatus Paracaedibacteraceae bacterium 'Lake Konstanz']
MLILSKYTFYSTKNNQGDFTVNLIKHILLALTLIFGYVSLNISDVEARGSHTSKSGKKAKNKKPKKAKKAKSKRNKRQHASNSDNAN